MVIETCTRCNGSGKEATSQQEVMEDLLEFSDVSEAADLYDSASLVFQITPSIENGTVIHVYDCDWIEATVMQVLRVINGYEVLAIYHHGNIKMMLHNICWNDTQKRHEYIRSGTPVYP